jgi:hypothetical protein
VIPAAGESDTISAQGHVIVHGPDPYDGFTFSSDGSVEADLGKIRVSSSEGLNVVAGPCAVHIGASEFSCTETSQTETVGHDTVQGAIVATETVHPPDIGLSNGAEAVVGVGLAGITALRYACGLPVISVGCRVAPAGG